MTEITTTMTQRGQVTIPAQVRRTLGLRLRDKVTFIIEGNEVRLVSPSFTLESAYGSVKPSQRPEEFEEISQVAKEAKAEKTLRKLHQE